MKYRLRNIDDSKSYFINKPSTSIGKENCDINVKDSPLIDRKHATLTVDKDGVLVINDENACHGTYVNDCRVKQTAVQLYHGDIIRLGHGGPRFEVLIESTGEPYFSKMSNLPTLSSTKKSATSRPYSSVHYGRHNGYVGHNKTDKITTSSVVPHPPVRSRPVSANPANGAFQQLNKPTISGNWTNEYIPTDNTGQNAMNSVMELDLRLTETEDRLTQLANYETERHKKDFAFNTLQDEIDSLRRSINTPANNTPFATGCQEKIAALHNQIQLKNENNENLQERNENLNSENDNLHDENERLKSELNKASANTAHEVSDMRSRLAQHGHKVSLVENELNRVNKEKSQMSLLLNSLQKEITSKDEIIRKTKEEVNKYKIDVRNKNMEVSSLAAKITKQTEIKASINELKQKEETIGNLKYRVKSLEDKLKGKESTIQDLQVRITHVNDTLSENEQRQVGKIDNLTYEIKVLEDKIRNKDSVTQNLRSKLTEATALSELEKQRLKNEYVELENIQAMSNILCGIEKRLNDNGRSCKSLNKEIGILKSIDVSEELRWMKECFLSFLCQECNWEQEIEDALKLVTEDSEREGTAPALLIQILHEKLGDNLKELNVLENKIFSAEHEHSKLYEDMKNNIKEKFKKKMEKALKDMKSDEQKRLYDEIKSVQETERKKAAETMESQRKLYEKDLQNLQVLSQDIKTLQKEKTEAKNEAGCLQISLDKYKKNEKSFQEKNEKNENDFKTKKEMFKNKLKEKELNEHQLRENLKEIEAEYIALKDNNGLKAVELEKLNAFKDKVHQQSLTITSLEYTIRSMEKGKKEMENKVEILERIAKENKHTESKIKKEEANVLKLSKEVEDFKTLNSILKKSAEDAQKELNEQKGVSKNLKNDLETTSAKLSDLKGELVDTQKLKVEHLEMRILIKEKEIKEQQEQMMKLSALVDEQKAKLIEQDKQITMQNEMLVDRGHIPWKITGNKEADYEVLAEFPEDMKRIGERCVGRKHDKIITEQNNVISDLRYSLSRVESIAPPASVIIPSHPDAQQICKLSNAIDDLKDELAAKEHQSSLTDQNLYNQNCQLRELLNAANRELSIEKITHENNQDALQKCDELYLQLAKEINEALDIQEIFGSKPVSYLGENERTEILKDRAKGLEVILNRIKSLLSRLERKDQLLEHYDDDLKNLRDTENLAGKKTFEVENLEKQLIQSKNEVSYLHEALKKCRGECDDLRRQNNTLKQNKVHINKVDYNYKEPSLKMKQSNPLKKKHKQRFDISEEEPVKDVY